MWCQAKARLRNLPFFFEFLDCRMMLSIIHLERFKVQKPSLFRIQNITFVKKYKNASMMCISNGFFEVKNTNSIFIFSILLEAKAAALNIIKDSFSDCYHVS